MINTYPEHRILSMDGIALSSLWPGPLNECPASADETAVLNGAKEPAGVIVPIFASGQLPQLRSVD